MPPKTKAGARKADSKPTNGAVQKRSTRGKQTKPAEAKKNVEPTKKGKPAKEQKVEEEEKEEDVEEQSADENAADEESMTEEQEEALRKEILGDMASDDDESSSDNEDQEEASGDAFKSSESVISLDPEQLKKSKEETKAKFDKKKKAPVQTGAEEVGVVYLGRIPHGFYEDEMKGYFSQFGTVTRLRLARNKRGQSKHYGFIEFQSAQVAEIVAETMDNYLLLGHLLQCKVLPKESVHENLFKFSSKRFRKANPSLVQQKTHNQKRSADKYHKRIVDLVKSENERRKKIKELGIDYEFPGYAAEYKKYKEAKAKDPKANTSDKAESKKEKLAAPKKAVEEKPAANKRKRNQKAESEETPKKEEVEAAKPAAKRTKRVTKPRAAKK